MDRSTQLQSFDLLATLVAVVRTDATLLFLNAALEDALGASRRMLLGHNLADYFTQAEPLQHALQSLRQHHFATLRYQAWLRRVGHEPCAVHVIVNRSDDPDEIVVEMLPQDQQLRQEREQRLLELAQTHHELVRNLVHEIKNPLGGLRGAAQLLELELDRPELHDYTRVIIGEADRLQSLVDRLLEPHRQPHTLGDMNIHEVCEHVRSLLLAEYPQGLRIERDYDTSLPELRADRSQLIQAVLNIARNACQALAARRAAGDACLSFRTRAVRQATFGQQRNRLALALHIVDNGPGVPDAIKDRIFYPLVSGREGGAGLGLSLAQTFVQQHHGSIELDSRPGHTDFTLFLPLP